MEAHITKLCLADQKYPLEKIYHQIYAVWSNNKITTYGYETLEEQEQHLKEFLFHHPKAKVVDKADFNVL